MPLSTSVLLIGTGLILICFSQRQILGKSLISIGLLYLILMSWHPVTTPMLRPIEQTHPSFDVKQPVSYVVALGNLVESDEKIPLRSQLSSSANARLSEAIRILRAQPNSQLIVTGYGGKNHISSAMAYKTLAIELGIAENRIISFEQPKDTEEEAQAVQQFLIEQNQPHAAVALATSASHMPRALQFFVSKGIKVYPAPTFYLAKYSAQTNWRFDSSGLMKSERAIYEYLGMAWQWIKSH